MRWYNMTTSFQHKMICFSCLIYAYVSTYVYIHHVNYYGTIPFFNLLKLRHQQNHLI